MNFYTKKRRSPVLQIINMIDILIILLIFLVVSSTFKDAPRSVLNIAVPTSQEMKLGHDEETRLSVTLTKDEKVFIAGDEVPVATMAEALAEFKAASPGAKLDLRIDERTPFGLIVKTWDALAKTGFKLGEIPTQIISGKKPTEQ